MAGKNTRGTDIKVAVTPDVIQTLDTPSVGDVAVAEGRTVDVSEQAQENADKGDKRQKTAAKRDQRRRLRRQGRKTFSSYKIKEHLDDTVVLFDLSDRVDPGLRRQAADMSLD
jgi:hypothetical protein